MSDGTDDDELEKIMGDFDSETTQQGKNSDASETPDNEEELSKEDLEEQFDGEYVASPTGQTQHLVETDVSQTLCGNDLREKEWPQSSEPGPFNPICEACKSALAGPATPTSESGMSTLNELRNWFSERVDIESAKENSGGMALTKAELQLVAEYTQSLESDNDHEL